jgi:hypothetical protein
VTGQRLPSARFVSANAVLDADRPDSQMTALVTQFGQLLDHDITRSALFQLGNILFEHSQLANRLFQKKKKKESNDEN